MFKSKTACCNVVYGTVLSSRYILFYKFSFALSYVMANLMLTFFNCKYIVVHSPHSDTCRERERDSVHGTCRGLLAIGRTTGLLLVGATDYPISTQTDNIKHFK